MPPTTKTAATIPKEIASPIPNITIVFNSVCYAGLKNKDISGNSKMPDLPIKCMKDHLLKLCTCTGIEISTAIGVTLYLLYLGEPILALISSVVFAKLIVFHFIMDYYDKKNSNKVAQNLSLKNT